MKKPVNKRPVEKMVLDVRQLECLRAPLRSEILSLLISEGPMSVTAMGRATGYPKKSLYYPLKKLIAVGLVRAAAISTEGRLPEQLFDAITDNLELPTEDPASLQLANQALVGTMSVALREVVRATEPGLVPGLDVVCHRNVVRLSPEDREELLRMLAEVSIFVRERADPTAPAFSLTMALVPRIPGTRTVNSSETENP